jgi:hypothetical protein
MEADGGAFVRYDPWATIDSEAFTPWGPLSDSWIRTGGRTIWLAASNSKSMRNTSVARLARKRGSRQKCSPRTFHRDPSSTPANLRRRGIIGSESHILPRSSREPDRARERTGCRRWGGRRRGPLVSIPFRCRASRSSRRDTKRGNPLEPKGMQFDSPFDPVPPSPSFCASKRR